MEAAQVVDPVAARKERIARKRGKRRERHLAFIERVDMTVLEKHTGIVADMALAADIDDDSPKPAGWTARQYRIARDARRGPREAPMYLAQAQRVVDSYKKAAAMQERDPSPVLNCDVQVFVQNNYSYAVIPEDKEDKP